MRSSYPFSIIGVGSPVVDFLAQVDESFLKTHVSGAKGGMELVSAETIDRLTANLPVAPTQSPGGSSGNTIFALARLGIPSTFLGKVGNDATARFYLDSFAANGGDISRFKTGSQSNARCLSLVTPDHERTLRTDLGAALTLDPNEITVADFAGCRHAHIEGYLLFNRGLLLHVVHCAREAGCTISLDLASFETVQAAADLLPDLLRNSIDIVFANEDEATAFLGQQYSYPEMARELAKMAGIGVVKIGKDGSYVAHQEEVTTIAPVVVDSVIDTTGAGDFWAAGFLYGWLRGKSLAQCGSNGSVMGAEVVQILGTSVAAERWTELRQSLA